MDKDKDTDKKVLVLSSEVVSRLTSSLSIDVILSNQARVFRALSSPSSEDGGMQLQCPTRTALTTDASTLLFMPGLLGSQTSVKCVSVPRTSRTGIPGTTLVFDADTGRVRAFVNASELTALRTAAGSVLATRAAKPDRHSVRHVALFGGGLQAFFHAWLLARVYPRSLTKITLFLTRGNTPSPTAQHTIDRLKACLGPGVHVEYTHDIERRLSEADVICCCTPAESPLFPAHCVRDGAHLNLVGSCELSLLANYSIFHRCTGIPILILILMLMLMRYMPCMTPR